MATNILNNIGSGNDLLPVRHQAITLTNDDMLLAPGKMFQ